MGRTTRDAGAVLLVSGGEGVARDGERGAEAKALDEGGRDAARLQAGPRLLGDEARPED
jgi:hypothetical protein